MSDALLVQSISTSGSGDQLTWASVNRSFTNGNPITFSTPSGMDDYVCGVAVMTACQTIWSAYSAVSAVIPFLGAPWMTSYLTEDVMFYVRHGDSIMIEYGVNEAYCIYVNAEASGVTLTQKETYMAKGVGRCYFFK